MANKKTFFLVGMMWEIPSTQDEPILPTQVAKKNAGFTLSCSLVDSAI